MLALHADKRQIADELLEGTGQSGPLSVDELLGLLGGVPGGSREAGHSVAMTQGGTSCVLSTAAGKAGDVGMS
jgi:hypothetical protein